MPAFFIFYLSRSGSTFLAKELCERYPVIIPPESNIMQSVLLDHHAWTADRGVDLILQDKKMKDWQIADSDIEELGYAMQSKGGFLNELCELYKNTKTSNAATIGIKKGNYIHVYQDLKAHFPNAKFIILVRDGRAIFSSQKNSTYSVTQKAFETNPIRSAMQWKQYARLAQKIKAEHPDNTMLLKYEELIQNTDEAFKKLESFIGLQPGESVMNYQVPERYGKELHQNIDKRPIANAINKWKEKLEASEISKFETIAGQDLEQNGYKRATKHSFLKNLFWKPIAQLYRFK